jgi:hypothetical protein
MASHHNSVLDPVPHGARRLIEITVEEILQSAPFRTSRQCQDFFRYIVEHSLVGSDESLRERVIGIEVFGRAPTYDTSEDPVVRLRAADVRKRLAQYYQAQKSEPGQWKIEIPTGSYRAQFSQFPPSEIALPPVQPSLTVVPPPVDVRPQSQAPALVADGAPRKGLRFWLLLLLAACLAAGISGALLSRAASQPASAFDLFWAPIMQDSRRVLVCTGSNRVYRLSEEARARYRSSHPRTEDTTPNLEVLVPKDELKKLRGEDFVPVSDTYLTIGDASTTTRVSSLFTARHHAYDVRFGSDLSFGDLREGSAVLIGAFNNSWTLNMTNNLRFLFDQGDSAGMHVQDRFDASRVWRPKVVDGKFVEDYAIVSRILESKTGTVLVTIAGLDHSGTRAAGDFVTNPQAISDLIKQAPKDWNRKNVQVVLHTNVVNSIPSPPTVVAAYYW